MAAVRDYVQADYLHQQRLSSIPAEQHSDAHYQNRVKGEEFAKIRVSLAWITEMASTRCAIQPPIWNHETLLINTTANN